MVEDAVGPVVVVGVEYLSRAVGVCNAVGSPAELEEERRSGNAALEVVERDAAVGELGAVVHGVALRAVEVELPEDDSDLRAVVDAEAGL